MTENFIYTVSKTPLLGDLYEHITPKYATDWKVIGALLGLPREELKIIEHDNHYKAVACCNAMLEKWLDLDCAATWKKILDAIQSPAVCNSQDPDSSCSQPLEKGKPFCICVLLTVGISNHLTNTVL